MNKNNLRKKYSQLMEDMAHQEHDSWSRWMIHLFNVSQKNDDGSVTIPKSFVDRWERQMITDYNDLSEQEKESDRDEVRKFIKILQKHDLLLITEKLKEIS